MKLQICKCFSAHGKLCSDRCMNDQFPISWGCSDNGRRSRLTIPVPTAHRMPPLGKMIRKQSVHCTSEMQCTSPELTSRVTSNNFRGGIVFTGRHSSTVDAVWELPATKVPMSFRQYTHDYIQAQKRLKKVALQCRTTMKPHRLDARGCHIPWTCCIPLC